MTNSDRLEICEAICAEHFDKPGSPRDADHIVSQIQNIVLGREDDDRDHDFKISKDGLVWSLKSRTEAYSANSPHALSKLVLKLALALGSRRQKP